MTSQHVVHLRGVNIPFPFQPYKCQSAYMEKVLMALQEGKNALLESPTGTGKTLCLLCAALAWREHAMQQRHVHQQPMQSKEQLKRAQEDHWGATAATAAATSIAGEPPGPARIIYASRTHTQLSQAVKELKEKTTFKPRVSIIGSRDQMCVHDDILRLDSSRAKVQACRAKVNAHSCSYKNSLDNNNRKAEVTAQVEQTIMDIEDLAELGRQKEVCPYYLTRDLQHNAEILFLPYNYLVDAGARRSNKIALDNAVVIFDEAHNLESICEDASSVELSSQDIAAAVAEISSAVEIVKNPTYGGAANSDDLLKLKELILLIERHLGEIALVPEKGANTPSATFPGTYVYDFFAKMRITNETRDPVVDTIDACIGVLTEQKHAVSMRKHQGVSLGKIADVLRLVFSDEMVGHREDVARFYRVHIAIDTAAEAARKRAAGSRPNEGVWAGSSGRANDLPPMRRLSFWCFSPGFAIRDLMRQGVRSILLTSGTLSPLSSFEAELQLPFPVRLENEHVIEGKQLCLSVVPAGPGGHAFNSSYQARQLPAYRTDLGNAIVNYARIIPDGLLVFFPSYSVMNMCIETWQRVAADGGRSVWERIAQYKTPLCEPRSKGEFDQAMEEFYSKIRDKSRQGAVFFAVCRGKVSEGLDFADSNGRGVIITGLPYPALQEPKVKLKRTFMDESANAPGRDKSVHTLTGAEWYQQQAWRAVNQAIGRVIRHRRDYGVIILADARFSTASSVKQLPLWLRPYVNVCQHFGESTKLVSQFFKVVNADASLQPEMALAIASRNAAASAAAAEATDQRLREMIEDGSLDPTSSVAIKVRKPAKVTNATSREGASALRSLVDSVTASDSKSTSAAGASLFSRLNAFSTGAPAAAVPTPPPSTLSARRPFSAAISTTTTTIASATTPASSTSTTATASSRSLFGQGTVAGTLPATSTTSTTTTTTTTTTTNAPDAPPATSTSVVSKADELQAMMREVLTKPERKQVQRSTRLYRHDRNIHGLVLNLRPVFDHDGREHFVQRFREFVPSRDWATFDKHIETLFTSKRLATSDNDNGDKQRTDTSGGGIEGDDDSAGLDEPVRKRPRPTPSQPSDTGANEGAIVCGKCRQAAQAPFVAPCTHAACHKCWSALGATPRCPTCDQRVARHTLRKLFFV